MSEERKIIKRIAEIADACECSRLCDICQDKVAALVTAANEDWMPIESAPKDGTEIILGHANSVWFDQWIADLEFEVREGEGGCWMMCDQWSDPEIPTHWMPAPALPNA